MNFLAWTILYIIIGFFEISSLIKNKMKKESVMFITIFSAAFVLSIIISLGVKIPSHDFYIGQIIRTIIGDTY